MRQLNLRIYTYAAAAVSLRDYTLRMLEASDDRVEQRSVTTALDALRTGPRSWFIRNLRNVIVHHRDLPVSPFVKFGGPTVRGAVFLNRDQLRPLRTAKEWGRAAELLDGGDDLIDLKETLDEHTAEALAAVRKLTVSVEQAYSDELIAALRLQDELTVIHQRIARRSAKS